MGLECLEHNKKQYIKIDIEQESVQTEFITTTLQMSNNSSV